ncbi:MAG TPA: sigma 54-interacting transcriptional regulator [Bacteroidota bacterium]|nr:sigma 54-interacting transcriptional regulator [Bacteroidota bacterium]
MMESIHTVNERDLDIVRSAAMQEVLKIMERVAASDLSVVLVGEQGTGKEWAARFIHRLSRRARSPFLPFDCGALSPEMMEKDLFGYEAVTREGVVLRRGAFEEADGGTVLINELALLPLPVQMKMARALEYQTITRVGGEQLIHIHTRIIGTLNRHPEALMDEGVLLREMYYRISPLVIELPALRDRKEDIPPMIKKILRELRARSNSTVVGISPKAIELCQAYHWPGNTRHLKNAIEYAAVMCPGKWIEPDNLPAYVRR